MLLPLNLIKEIERIEDFEIKIHEAAKLYAEAGIHVVPLRPNSKILPDKSTGINYQSCSNKPKTMDKWFGPNGKFRGWNIGIVCGREGGVFAVDLDLHGRANGLETWQELLGDRDLYCPVQQTPTGGQHLLLRWQKNLTSSSGKLGPGVDTRGGDGTPRSHIVAFPSRTADGEYSWIEGGEIPGTPDWITDKMGVPWQGSAGRGNDNVTQKDVEHEYPLSAFAAMVTAIDPDECSYEEWLWVGQAINSQHPDKQGLKLWDEWSATGKRYERGECEKRWVGFNPAGPIRVGTLIWLAKLHGYDPLDDEIAAGSYKAIVERMNQDNAVVLIGGKVRILHRDENGGLHIMGTQDANTLFYNKKVKTPGDGKIRTIFDIWMGEEGRRECVNGMGFFPGEDLWYKGYVNLWQGWGYEPEPGDWSRFNDHIKDVLCNGDSELHTFILDWCADILQNPMDPKGTAIVLRGDEGTGKGTFAYVLGQIVGHKHYKHVTNERHLTGNFNYHLMDGLLIFADEVTYGGDKKHAGVLKALVTEKELICERKGLDSFMFENRSRLVVASNNDWVIPAGTNSRRWLVLEVPTDRASDKPYFDAIYKQMIEDGGCSAMMHDLLKREITSNLTRAPETEGLHYQREMSRTSNDPVDAWFDECKGMRSFFISSDREAVAEDLKWPEEIERTELFRQFMKWAKEGKHRTKGVTHFYKKVESYGFISYRPRLDDGSRPYRFKVPPYERFEPKSRSNN